MTVEARPEEQIPDPRDFGMAMRERDELPAELPALVDQVRGLADAATMTDVAGAELAEVAELVAEATRRLRARQREFGLLVRDRVGGVARFNTLGNAVTGDGNPMAPPLALTPQDGGVAGEVTMGPVYEGPPGCVHGGWVAALLDQAVGESAWQVGAVVMTGTLTVDYRRPTPLNMPLHVSGRIDRDEGRKIAVSGRITSNGRLTAEATGMMVRIWPPKGG